MLGPESKSRPASGTCFPLDHRQTIPADPSSRVVSPLAVNICYIHVCVRGLVLGADSLPVGAIIVVTNGSQLFGAFCLTVYVWAGRGCQELNDVGGCCVTGRGLAGIKIRNSSSCPAFRLLSGLSDSSGGRPRVRLFSPGQYHRSCPLPLSQPALGADAQARKDRFPNSYLCC